MTLGVVSSGDPNYGPSSTMSGFTRACRDSGYAVQVATVADVDRTSLHDAVDDLVGRGVDGVVVVVAARTGELAAVQDLTIPKPLVVLTSGPAPPDAVARRSGWESALRQAGRTVVRGGRKCPASGMSSKPTTLSRRSVAG